MNEKYNYEYEELLGAWFTARCKKRCDLKGMMPQKVITWLLTGGNSPVTGDTNPTSDVYRWVVKTMDDPDWPEPVPVPPDPPTN